MRFFSSLICTILIGATAALVGCAQGPSIKQRADEAVTERTKNKQSEEFAKSLPPTQSTPIYKP